MNCSYLSTKCEHVSILIPIIFTLKVQENLNNIVQVLCSYNTHYKTKKTFWPHYPKIKSFFLLYWRGHTHMYTCIYYIHIMCTYYVDVCEQYTYLISMISAKLRIGLTQVSFRKCRTLKWVITSSQFPFRKKVTSVYLYSFGREMKDGDTHTHTYVCISTFSYNFPRKINF